jgi:hypothetical protein
MMTDKLPSYFKCSKCFKVFKTVFKEVYPTVSTATTSEVQESSEVVAAKLSGVLQIDDFTVCGRCWPEARKDSRVRQH